MSFHASHLGAVHPVSTAAHCSLTICVSNFTHRHVKTLESRSQLLDAALASADEANRRWEECRTIVDQLRIENATLRAALQATQAQLMALNPNANLPMPDPNSGAVNLNGANGAPPPQGPPADQQQQTSAE